VFFTFNNKVFPQVSAGNWPRTSIWMAGSRALTTQLLFEKLAKWDNFVLHWLHSRNTPLGIHLMGTLTCLGAAAYTSILGVGLGVVLVRKRKWKVMIGWSAALIGGPIIENILKWSVRRPRPEFATPFLSSFSYSFPSGHAMNATIVYGMLTYILVTVWPWRRTVRTGIIISCVLLVLGIGFSRLYLGVHYLTDVLGGFAAGSVWLTMCILFTAYGTPRAEPLRPQITGQGVASKTNGHSDI